MKLIKITALILCLALSAGCAAQTAEVKDIETPVATATLPVETPAPSATPAPVAVEVELRTLEDSMATPEETTLADIICTFPSFIQAEGENEGLSALGEEIKESELNWMDEVRVRCQEQFSEEYVKSLNMDDFMPYSFERIWGLSYRGGNIVSFLIDSYEFSGGAYPAMQQEGRTYDLSTGKELMLTDILNGTYEDAHALMAGGFSELVKSAPEEFMPEAATVLSTGELNESFYLTDTGVTFVLPEGVIAFHDYGLPEYSLPYAGNESLFKFPIEAAE